MKKIVIVLLLLFIKVNASVVVMDADSNRVLYSSNMNERKLIASTTKVMTSLIALDMGSLDDKITIGEEILKVKPHIIEHRMFVNTFLRQYLANFKINKLEILNL